MTGGIWADECVSPELKECDTTLGAYEGIAGIVECIPKSKQTVGSLATGVIGFLHCGVLVNLNGDVVSSCGGLRTTRIPCPEK